jgi:hypothetical protein
MTMFFKSDFPSPTFLSLPPFLSFEEKPSPLRGEVR